MRKNNSRLAGIAWAAPLVLASLTGCTVDYHGKTVHWWAIKRHLQSGSDGEAGKKAANFGDRDGDGDIDPDDTDKLRPALIAGAFVAYGVDWVIRAYEEFRDGVRDGSIPLLNSQNYNNQPE